MKRCLIFAIVLFMAAAVFAHDALSCPFCNPGLRNQATLCEEAELADFVFFGRAVSSALAGPDGKTVKIWFGDPHAN